MQTVIDSLVVLFGLDPSGFGKGAAQIKKDLKSTRDEASAASKEIAAKGKEAAEFFREMRNQAVALFAVITAGSGFKQLIEDITNANAQMGLLSKNIGTATEELNAWSNASELAGGNGKDTLATFSMLSQAGTEFAITGQTAILPFLRTLGINLADATGRARPLDDVLLDLADQFALMDRPTANNFGRMMGLDQSTMNLLLQGRQSIEATIKKQKEHFLITKADAEQSLRLKQAFIGLRQETEALWRQFVSAITPGLISFGETLSDIGNWIAANKTIVVAFFTSLAAVITLYFLPAVVRAAIAVWAMIAPFALIVVAILAVAAALALLAEDWYVWLTGGESALGAFWQFFADGWNEAKATFSGTIEAFKKIFDDFIEFIRRTWELIVAIFTGSGEDIKAAGAAMGKAFLDGFTDTFDGIKQLWKDTVAFFKGETAGKVGDIIQQGVTATGAYLKGRGEAIDQLAPDRGARDTRPRGIRNNNPGNLEYGAFTRSRGATGIEAARGTQKGRFATFATMEEGIAAADAKLKSYITGGTDTIAKIVNRYAPASDGNNVPAYIAALSKATGKGANETLNPGDGDTMLSLLKGIIDHESGAGRISRAQIAAALRPGGATGNGGVIAQAAGAASSGVPVGPIQGALGAAAPAGARAQAALAQPIGSPGAGTGGNVITSDVQIGQIVVNTQATDAQGIADGIGGALRAKELVYQADAGMN